MRYFIFLFFFNFVFSQDIGQKMFNNGDSDSAIKYYRYLLENENLSKDDILYNLASIYSSIDSIKKAEDYFNLALQDSLNPSADLSYNRGNMFYKSRNLEESLKSYRDALLKNPNDNEARMNYEFVKNEIDEKNKNQQQNQDNNDESQEPENNKNNQNEDQNQGNENKDSKSNNTDKNPKNNNNDDGPTDQDSSQTPKEQNNQDRQMSIDQNVENILNAMKENEKVNKKRKQNNYSNESGKEW